MVAAGQGEALEAMVKSVPKGRYGRAEEIADAVLWLCSGAASYVTGQSRAIAFGFFTHRFQAGKLIQAASASFSMRKSAFLRGMSEQINTVRSRIQTGSGSFCNSDVKKIPNAIPLLANYSRLETYASLRQNKRQFVLGALPQWRLCPS
jgi:hypothetical protein